MFRERLDEAGLLRICWPESLGGQAKSPIFEYIMRQELQEVGLEPRVGVTIMSAVIDKFGTPEQKDEFLQGLLSREIRTCAGYSEPRGGSDLAALETRAVRDGEDWVINGQKIYTTGAERADFMWCLARTDPDAPKHQGISIFMVDMKSPGVTVRPLYTMGSYLTAEVFLDDVRVPHRRLIGEENRGWYLNTLALDFERINMGSYGAYKRYLDAMIAFARETELFGKPLAQDPAVRLRLAELIVDLETLRHLSNKCAWLVSEDQNSTMIASMAKVWSTEFYYRMTNFATQMMGPFGQLQKGSKWAMLDGEAELGYRNTPPPRFGGGGSEIQRDIIATRGLGLPRSR
ncbi:Acyl-CoA dehydrogenase-like [Sphingobium indicum BiD32]|uniref:Acyl-CoA dehydrogenase-like n=1 Tax=Sphingobium indicum BiD32 TaxID=1301087 RepID=N1MH81_9SPHN|nr:Acyl-CoA dehydrogenase-like [Sphingobium indicum BiD32]